MRTPLIRLSALVFLGLIAAVVTVAKPLAAGSARITILSPTLVRLEHSPAKEFVDDTTVLVRTRNWPKTAYQSWREEGQLQVKTEALQIRYKIGGPFDAENLSIAWNWQGRSGRWSPGQKDEGNLGGTRGALDGIRAGHLPPLGQGLLSRSGYTLLSDTTPLWPPGEWLRERPDDDAQDWYFFAYGHDYARFFREYTQLCGKVPLLPRYAFGAWYSRYWAYTAQEERALVERFRREGIPLDVLVIDVDWHKYGWEGYDWNTELFPDPKGFLKWVHAQGLRVTLNNHPGSPLPKEDSHHAAACAMAGADPAQPLKWNLADERHARAFQEAVHWPLEAMGIDFWWIDGAARSQMKGLNSAAWCARTYYDGTQRRTGHRSLVFSRYGGLGQHRYPTGFSGDVHSQWEVLAYEVPFTSRAGNVLFPYWSHDIGGFMGDKLDPELYVRWCQFGALSPVLRLHSNHGIREPWAYGPDAERIVRDFFRLRYRLFPYLYTASAETHLTGLPLCRPLYLAYPEREQAYGNDQEYLLGPDLLVAPVTSPGTDGVGAQSVWLPPGFWTDYFTGEVYRGPRLMRYRCPLDRAPMFVRAGAVIPHQPDTLNLSQLPEGPLTLQVFPGPAQVSRLYEDDGLSLDYQKGAGAWTELRCRSEGDRVVVNVGATVGEFKEQREQRAYVVQVRGVTRPGQVLVEGRRVGRVGSRRQVEQRQNGWWFDSDRAEVWVGVPERSIRRGFEVALAGVRGPEALIERTRTARLLACARAAKGLAAGAPEAVQAALDKLIQAADSARRALMEMPTTEAKARAREDQVRSAFRQAWTAVARAVPEGDRRSDILRALAGLMAGAELRPAGKTGALEVATSLSAALPLAGVEVRADRASPEGWSLVGEATAELEGLSTGDEARFSYSVRPGDDWQAPLGELVLGARFNVTWQNATVPVAAETRLDCSYVQQFWLIGPFDDPQRQGVKTVCPPEQKLDLKAEYQGKQQRVKFSSACMIPTSSLSHTPSRSSFPNASKMRCSPSARMTAASSG